MIVEDSRVIRQFLEHIIGNDPRLEVVELLTTVLAEAGTHLELHAVHKLTDGLRAVHNADWQVVLAELSLPDSEGLDTVRTLRRHAPGLSIIAIQSSLSNETAMAVLDAGAQDYFVKSDFTPASLGRAIRYAIQRQMNAEMRRLIDQLQEHEHVLKKKNRRLARLYKTAHRFVDNASHDFRTPLTVIKEYVALLREGIVGELNAEQAQMLDVVNDRADDLNNMVDDMLDTSKLEAGMMGIWRSTCAVGEIVAHIAPSLKKKSRVKEVDIEFDIPQDLPEVFCDGEKVGRVIVNLTTNAIKFSGDPGRVRVWARDDRDNDQVVIGVSDNGFGIAPECLRLIFQRFKQINYDPRQSTKGFGLGLNIANELVRLNLGDMSVQSEQGNGSTFSFTVPVSDPTVVVRRYAKRLPPRKGVVIVSLLKVGTDKPCTEVVATEFDRFLNCVLRRNDLVFRVGEQEWLLVLAAAESELPMFHQRAEKLRQEANQNSPKVLLPEASSDFMGSYRLPDELEDFLASFDAAALIPEVLYA